MASFGSNWQPVNDDTERLMVPGGWLVKVSTPWPLVNSEGMVKRNWDYVHIAVTFVPDPKHAWIIGR